MRPPAWRWHSLARATCTTPWRLAYLKVDPAAVCGGMVERVPLLFFLAFNLLEDVPLWFRVPWGVARRPSRGRYSLRLHVALMEGRTGEGRQARACAVDDGFSMTPEARVKAVHAGKAPPCEA